jgi:two-component system sensor histidine kinase RegB
VKAAPAEASAASNPSITGVLTWILCARYTLAAAQLAVVLLVHFGFGLRLPLPWLMLAPATTCVTNLALWRHRETASDAWLRRRVLWSFVVDTIGLTVTLALTGGPTNPFTVLYVVQITLSTLLLSKTETWLLGACAALGYGCLFVWYEPIPGLAVHMHDIYSEHLHLVGMWVSLVVATILITLFSGKVSELLRARERALLHAQAELARKDRLSALATLAAGAAHELATPLGTIAIVARELERQAHETMDKEALRLDSSLIRREVERCKEILQAMSAHGAEYSGEMPERIRIDALLQQVSASHPVVWSTPPVLLERELYLPPRAVVQSLRNLVRNAHDAAPGLDPEIDVYFQEERVRFSVRDRGPGMSEEVLRRVGEPFFTTKSPHGGMGLGVFLIRSMAQQFQGSLSYTSGPSGTTATLELPTHWSHLL